MKTFWKIIAGAAIAGALFVVIGLLLGANTGGFYIDRNGIQMSSGSEFSRISESVDVIRTLDIDVRSSTVRIVEVDSREGFGFAVSAPEGRFSHSFEEGRLAISQERPTLSWFNFSFGLNLSLQREYVEVRIPAGAILDNAAIRVTSGRIDIESLYGESVNLRITSGNLTANNLRAETLIVTSTSGSVNLDGEFGDTSVTATSGGVTLGGVFSGDTTVSLTSGRVRLNIEGSEHDFNTNAGVTSGTLRGLPAGNVNRGAAQSLSVHVTSGSVNVSFSE